jgi:hypothetical protein
VRDHERRAVLQQIVERGLHEPLALGVECAGRLVEQQDRRILEYCARDRDPLPLSTLQPDATLAEKRLVALGQPLDEAGTAASPPCTIAGRIRSAVAMFSIVRREDHGVLRHDADPRAHSSGRGRSTPSTGRHLARIVEANSNWNSVRLPAPDGPTTATVSSELQRQIDQRRMRRSD